MNKYILIGTHYDATISLHVEATSKEMALRMWKVMLPKEAHYDVDVFDKSEFGDITWKKGHISSYLAKY
jgi:hypothetical protein